MRRGFNRLEARKKAYEMRKQARIAALEARKAQYEKERALLGLGIGFSSRRMLTSEDIGALEATEGEKQHPGLKRD